MVATVLFSIIGSAPAVCEEVKVMQGSDFYLIQDREPGECLFALRQVRRSRGLGALADPLCRGFALRFQTPSGVSGQVISLCPQEAASTTLVFPPWIKPGSRLPSAKAGEAEGAATTRRATVVGTLPTSSTTISHGESSAGHPAGIRSSSSVSFPSKPQRQRQRGDRASRERRKPGRPALYFTAGSILDPFELRLKAACQSGRLPYLGGAARLTLQSGALYVDGLWLQDRPFASEFGFGASTGSWFRYCAGGNWTIDISQSRLADSLYLQAEYLRQDDGLDAGQMASYFDGLGSMPLATASDAASYGTAAETWNGRFFALGRDYLYAAFSMGEIANAHIGLSASGILDVDELSFAVQSSLTWSPRNLFSICLSATNFGGRSGGRGLDATLCRPISLTLTRSF